MQKREREGKGKEEKGKKRARLSQRRSYSMQARKMELSILISKASFQTLGWQTNVICFSEKGVSSRNVSLSRKNPWEEEKIERKL